MKRESGILYPVSSLPSRFGIGSFSREAYEFIDFLKEAGQSYWQVLPLCQTGFSLPVGFFFCGKSLLYRSGKAHRRGTPYLG